MYLLGCDQCLLFLLYFSALYSKWAWTPPLGNNGYYKELLPFENQNMKQGSLDLNQSSNFFDLNQNDFLNKNLDFLLF